MVTIGYIPQLRREAERYGQILIEHLNLLKEDTWPFTQLSSMALSTRLNTHTDLLEQARGQGYLLVHHVLKPEEGPEELVLNVQGYLLEANLPPIRQHQLPRNLNRLVDMKQSVTITGLGVEGFDDIVRGVKAIYQHFHNHIMSSGCRLRDWNPGRDHGQLTLTFASRYLTTSRNAGGEASLDLATEVDPLNILRPLLVNRTEVHLSDNVVQYWERTEDKSADPTFKRIKPEGIHLGNLVEIQVAFMAVRVGRQEFVFLPKLRSICLLSRLVEQDHNSEVMKTISSQKVSPLKKVKRKVGYGLGDGSNASSSSATTQLKRMCLTEDRSTAAMELDVLQ